MITVTVGSATIFCQLNELGEVLRQISGNSPNIQTGRTSAAGTGILAEAIRQTQEDMDAIRKIDPDLVPSIFAGGYDGPLTPPGEDFRTKADEYLYKATYKENKKPKLRKSELKNAILDTAVQNAKEAEMEASAFKSFLAKKS